MDPLCKVFGEIKLFFTFSISHSCNCSIWKTLKLINTKAKNADWIKLPANIRCSEQYAFEFKYLKCYPNSGSIILSNGITQYSGFMDQDFMLTVIWCINLSDYWSGKCCCSCQSNSHMYFIKKSCFFIDSHTCRQNVNGNNDICFFFF